MTRRSQLIVGSKQQLRQPRAARGPFEGRSGYKSRWRPCRHPDALLFDFFRVSFVCLKPPARSVLFFVAASDARHRKTIRQAPWLADLMTSWFSLPVPRLPSPSGTSRAETTNRRFSSARDGIRAEILQVRSHKRWAHCCRYTSLLSRGWLSITLTMKGQVSAKPVSRLRVTALAPPSKPSKALTNPLPPLRRGPQLRVSNAELREEVGALRKSMVDRGYVPVEDIFAVTTRAASSAGGEEAAARNDPQQNSKKPPAPPAKLPREARLAALVVLYGAAVAVGGVFVPIAIGVGASRSLRWLDEGGTLMPKRWRRRGGGGAGGRGQEGRRRRRWKDAVLSYVPVVARSRGRGDVGAGDGAGGVMEDAGLVTAEALADAWDKMYPPRR